MDAYDRQGWARAYPARPAAVAVVVPALPAFACCLAAALVLAFLTATAAGAAPPARASVAAPVSTMLPEPAPASAAPLDPAPAPTAEPLAVTAAPKPGSGLWYWPVGTEDFQGWSGWLDSRGAYYHVAQDMPAPMGHPVYAIADGVVWKARMDAGGYGPGGSLGGVMIIIHKTASGQSFRALYGHIKGLRFKEGQKVTAGAVIASVNACVHVHFSIHPGTVYRDGNMYAGHVPKTWADHGGFVNPVKFLRTHPRLIPYLPPALPLVTVTTRTEPSGYGAADGAAYWTEEGAAGSVTYRVDLATGVRRSLDPGEVVPPFDLARYQVRQLPSPRVGFTVVDHLPGLPAAVVHATPRWGVPARFGARLLSAAGRPFTGGIVRLERRHSGVWERVAAAPTAADGRVALKYRPLRTTLLRLRFVPPATQPARRTYLPVTSTTLTVAPHVLLPAPTLPATIAHGRQVAITGTMRPRHAAGSRVVSLLFQRRAAGVWTTVTSRGVVCRDDDAESAYRCLLRFYRVGSWRVRAVHAADPAHAASVGVWRAFTVR